MTYVLVVTLYLMGADGLSHPGPSRVKPQPTLERCQEVKREFVKVADSEGRQYTIGCRPWRKDDPLKGDPA